MTIILMQKKHLWKFTFLASLLWNAIKPYLLWWRCQTTTAPSLAHFSLSSRAFCTWLLHSIFWIKLPRSKHCSLCGICVPTFDHHCVWINQCVGENNRKYFLLFLLVHTVYFSYASYVLFRVIISEVSECLLLPWHRTSFIVIWW